MALLTAEKRREGDLFIFFLSTIRASQRKPESRGEFHACRGIERVRSSKRLAPGSPPKNKGWQARGTRRMLSRLDEASHL